MSQRANVWKSCATSCGRDGRKDGNAVEVINGNDTRRDHPALRFEGGWTGSKSPGNGWCVLLHLLLVHLQLAPLGDWINPNGDSMPSKMQFPQTNSPVFRFFQKPRRLKNSCRRFSLATGSPKIRSNNHVTVTTLVKPNSRHSHSNVVLLMAGITCSKNGWVASLVKDWRKYPSAPRNSAARANTRRSCTFALVSLVIAMPHIGTQKRTNDNDPTSQCLFATQPPHPAKQFLCQKVEGAEFRACGPALCLPARLVCNAIPQPYLERII